MVQVIPFRYGSYPEYLPLLARGLADLTTLRFNTVQIEAHFNRDLQLKSWPLGKEVHLDGDEPGQTLWFSGEIRADRSEIFDVVMFLYDPDKERSVYYDSYQTSAKEFLYAWENHIRQIFKFLAVETDPFNEDRVIYTHSLDAFLEFRRGLEILSLAKKPAQREEGLERLLSAVTYDSGFLEAVDILLLFLMQNNSVQYFDEILQILERLRAVAKNHPRVPLVMAEIYFQWGNLEKAEYLLKEVLKDHPGFSDGWLRLALFYQYQEKYSEALETLQVFVGQDAKNAMAFDLMGAICAGLGKRAEAEAAWNNALDLDPSRVNVLNNLGLLAEENDDPELAEFYYRKAIQMNDQWWGSFYNFGSYCKRRGRIEESVHLLRKAGVLNPSHAATFLNLAETQLKSGHYVEAQETVIQLLQIAPNNLFRRQGLQILEYFNGRPIQAEIRIRNLARSWQGNSTLMAVWLLVKNFTWGKRLWYYWYLWAQVLEQLKLKCLAGMALRIGLRRNPGYSLVRQLGLWYWEKNWYAKALPLLRKTFQLNQSDAEAVAAYFETLLRLGEVDEYQKQLKHFAKIGHNIGV